MIRLVLDTNVVASALLWGGKPATLLNAARDQRVALFSSIPMLHELSGILDRPKFKTKREQAAVSVERLVEGYAALTDRIVRPRPITGIAPDPDDDVVIATAYAARVEAIVTGDAAFLSVGSYEGIAIITVARAVAMLA